MAKIGKKIPLSETRIYLLVNSNQAVTKQKKIPKIRQNPGFNGQSGCGQNRAINHNPNLE